VSGPPTLDADPLEPGLYETLVTEELARRIDQLRDRAQVGDLQVDETPRILAAHIAEMAVRVLRAQADATRQLDVANDLVRRLKHWATDSVDDGDLINRSSQLLSVSGRHASYLGDSDLPPRPRTPLSQNNLLVHAHAEPSFGSELISEIQSADHVDLICAFVVWNAVRLLRPALESLIRRGGRIRVLTTTYTGITEARALDELTAIGAEVRVSYDTASTRLHAKAWLFERGSGFSTAYVGSSNLTHTALHDGLEWNVRLSQIASADLLERFRAAFETYWAGSSFEPYEATKFAAATQRARTTWDDQDLPFDLRPQPFQEEMLERLEVERVRHGHWRNLIVSATGTGKTVVSAFDFVRLRQAWGDPTILFIAHREEILRQTLSTYRAVLKDGAFGELYAGGSKPVAGRHVFASVQSLSRLDLKAVDPRAYDVIVVDEFHHAAAPTYERLLYHFHPRVLLGLTATPERQDQLDVTKWFDGRIDFELRLWDALEQGLLCPFQYFGVADDVDLSQLEWKRGGYDSAALADLYVNHDARVTKVLRALRDTVTDPLTMRALGFCVSVEHARYMARRLNEAGIPAIALTGESDADARSIGLRDLRERRVNAIFSVDVFNEGLDVPEVDTVMFLRPTESVTVFLQQLGRGLRRHPGKAGLTVLDFIGQQHRSFRFEPRIAALTGRTRGALIKDIEEQFPYLPAGCSIQLDRVSQNIVLRNVRDSVITRRDQLVQELRQCGDVSLAQFLKSSGRSLEDVYRPGGGCWSELRRRAGLATPAAGPNEPAMAKALARMRHIDDDERVDVYCKVLREEERTSTAGLLQREVRLLTMLHLDLFGREAPAADLSASLDLLWLHPAIRAELLELLPLQQENSDSLDVSIPTLDPTIPLHLHQRYTDQEVLAALGESTIEKAVPFREGVRYVNNSQHPTDLLFVTLEKSPTRYSPSTMYHDYPESASVFHWESQSRTTAASPTGQRYINHVRNGSQVLMFIRKAPDLGGFTQPYMFAGPVRYLDHKGDRPMAVRWALDYRLPADFVQGARAAG